MVLELDIEISDKERKFYVAAEPLFERFGFQKTTVEDICKAAGASKRTFYELFSGKGDLFARMILCLADDTIGTRQEGKFARLDARKRLEIYIDKYSEFCGDHPVLRLCFFEPEVLMGFGDVFKQYKKSPACVTLEDIITTGVAAGVFRKQDPWTTTNLILTMLDSVFFIKPVITGEPGPLEDKTLAREMRAFILNAVGATDVVPGESTSHERQEEK